MSTNGNKEIVLVIGYPAAGKTTAVQEFVDLGYHRINRDTTGGLLKDVPGHIQRALPKHDRIVIDNTYATVESRADVIALGKELGIDVNCVWLKTSYEDAQFNSCMRMMEKYGRILMPEDFPKEKNVNVFPPAVLFKYKASIEEKKDKKAINQPSVAEGFKKVTPRNFVRVWSKEYCNKAIILDADGTVRISKGASEWPVHPDEVEIIAGCGKVIQEYKDKDYLILGASNQSTCEKEGFKTPRNIVDDCFERTNELLGHDIEWSYCPHYRFPVQCYCRKPHVGMAVYMIYTYKLDPKQCIMVGDSTSDKTFAKRAGFQFQSPQEFFGSGSAK